MKQGDLVYLIEWEKYGIIVVDAKVMVGTVPQAFVVQCFCGFQPLVWADEIELLNEAR